MVHMGKMEFLLSVVLIFCAIEETAANFLYICVGDCAWWEYLLMGASVLLCLVCCFASCTRYCVSGSSENEDVPA